MAEQLADRDAVSAGDAGDVFRDGVVEAELAFVLQQQDRGGGELLGDRGDLVGEVGVGGGDRFGGFAVCLGEHDPATADHGDRGGWHAGIAERVGHQRVDLRGFGGGERLR